MKINLPGYDAVTRVEVQKITEVSEEYITSIFGVEDLSKHISTKGTASWALDVFLSYYYTTMMELVRSYETTGTSMGL
jgi:hypothetical protein